MGSDDLFRKRKARKMEDLARHTAKRSPYSKVLIVCEGERTEPFYFEGLKSHYQLNSANIEITGDCGSAPISIFEHANKRFKEEDRAGDPFDKVFCVFDKDQHDTYNETLKMIRSAEPKDTFVAINSVPCFEYWLVLHYEYTNKAFGNLHKNSAANQMVRELLRFMPDYEKGQNDIFSRLVQSLEFAKTNAERALTAAQRSHTDDPSTHVHELVEFLQNIKKQDSGAG
jgi:hypothetical protein